jgi:hypothetical protein
MNKTGREKGSVPWNKGITGYKQPKISIALTGKYRGEKSGRWQGNKITYGTLHEWVYRELGRPDNCEQCGRKEENPYKIHWANRSGEYKRELTDWIRLCILCHKKQDKHSEKLKAAWERGAYRNRDLSLRR